MGYAVETPFTINLSGRGKKEVDVYIRDNRASVNQIMLVECKFWESEIPQDAVHSFHTVMSGAGANTGFIVSKKGFQSGAYEAINNTNIHLLTWEEIQHKFGHQWYLCRSKECEYIFNEARIIDGLYMDQFNPAVISNMMFFTATGCEEEFLDVMANIRIILFSHLARPAAYDTPGPIEVSVYEGFPGAAKDRWGVPTLRFSGAREFFIWFEAYGKEQLVRFETIRSRARASFDVLPDQDAAFRATLKATVEELPIRAFREELGEDLYSSLIARHLVNMR